VVRIPAGAADRPVQHYLYRQDQRLRMRADCRLARGADNEEQIFVAVSALDVAETRAR